MSLVRSFNPSDPSVLIASAPAASAADVDRGVAVAERAGAEWARTPAAERAARMERLAAVIERRAGELAAMIVAEVGKPVVEARGEVARAVAIVRYQAQTALHPRGDLLPPSAGSWLLLSERRARGVCALITPWNFPLAIPVWKAAPALAWGNAVLLKCASPALRTGQLLAEACAEALPDGLFQLLPGGRETAQALIDHPGVDCISFTGSDATGRDVIARGARRAVPVQAELGGQNPAIVLADADLDVAARTLAHASMGFAGQKCTATSRIVVEEPVRERLTALLREQVAALGVGDPREERTVVGPLITEQARDDARTAVAAAVERGGELLAGGSADGSGHLLAPTLVGLASPGDPLAQEEVFAPVAAIVGARDLDDAIEIANGVRYGLAAAVFTQSLERAARVTGALRAGLVRVNQSTAGVDLHAPFGGVKGSSYGPREQGPAAHEFFTTVHTVSIAGPAA